MAVDTVIGPVTIGASPAGLCKLDLPGPEHLRLEALWADLGLPRRAPLPGDFLADFGLDMPMVEIDAQGTGQDDGAADGAGDAEGAGDGAAAQPRAQFDPRDMAERAREAVEDFFACRLDREGLGFPGLAVDVSGMSRFRVLVTQGMRVIPGGSVASYSALARAAGNPRAPRGAGSMVGANPVGLVVPCHRVVGATGKLTGYGGSLPLKVVLLALERRMAGGGA